MTKIPYESPAEIRDLTAKSVEEARKAFGSFIVAAHKATAQAEEASARNPPSQESHPIPSLLCLFSSRRD
jgi:hypothetical protein